MKELLGSLFCILIGVALIVFMVWIGPFIFMVCWNCVMPLFGLPKLAWIQAFCLSVVLSFIFGKNVVKTRKD